MWHDCQQNNVLHRISCLEWLREKILKCPGNLMENSGTDLVSQNVTTLSTGARAYITGGFMGMAS